MQIIIGQSSLYLHFNPLNYFLLQEINLTLNMIKLCINFLLDGEFSIIALYYAEKYAIEQH